MSAVPKIAYFWRTAVGGIARSPFVHVIAVSSLAIALSGHGLARLAAAQLDHLLDTLAGDVEMTVYLADGTDADKVKELQAALTQRTGTESRVVSPAEALGRLASQLGEAGDALVGLQDNPLPWSVELVVPATSRDPAGLKALAGKVRSLPFVTGVDYGEEAVDKLSAIGGALRLASLVIFAIVFFTTVIVVAATLQLAIYARREEIEIQKLVGATDRFVRAPFLIEGLLQGLSSAAVAIGALWAFAVFATPKLAQLLPFLAVEASRPNVPLRLMAEIVALGVLLGLSGSVVAVRRFMRV